MATTSAFSVYKINGKSLDSLRTADLNETLIALQQDPDSFQNNSARKERIRQLLVSKSKTSFSTTHEAAEIVPIETSMAPIVFSLRSADGDINVSANSQVYRFLSKCPEYWSSEGVMSLSLLQLILCCGASADGNLNHINLNFTIKLPLLSKLDSLFTCVTSFPPGSQNILETLIPVGKSLGIKLAPSDWEQLPQSEVTHVILPFVNALNAKIFTDLDQGCLSRYLVAAAVANVTAQPSLRTAGPGASLGLQMLSTDFTNSLLPQSYRSPENNIHFSVKMAASYFLKNPDVPEYLRQIPVDVKSYMAMVEFERGYVAGDRRVWGTHFNLIVHRNSALRCLGALLSGLSSVEALRAVEDLTFAASGERELKLCAPVLESLEAQVSSAPSFTSETIDMAGHSSSSTLANHQPITAQARIAKIASFLASRRALDDGFGASTSRARAPAAEADDHGAPSDPKVEVLRRLPALHSILQQIASKSLSAEGQSEVLTLAFRARDPLLWRAVNFSWYGGIEPSLATLYASKSALPLMVAKEVMKQTKAGEQAVLTFAASLDVAELLGITRGKPPPLSRLASLYSKYRSVVSGSFDEQSLSALLSPGFCTSFLAFLVKFWSAFGVDAGDLLTLPEILRRLGELVAPELNSAAYTHNASQALEASANAFASSLAAFAAVPLRAAIPVPAFTLARRQLDVASDALARLREQQQAISFGIHGLACGAATGTEMSAARDVKRKRETQDGAEMLAQKTAKPAASPVRPGSRIPVIGKDILTKEDEAWWGGDVYSISKLKQAWKTNTGGVKFDLPAAMCRASSEALFLSKVPKDISEQTKTKYLKYWADGARSAAFLRSSVARQDFQ